MTDVDAAFWSRPEHPHASESPEPIVDHLVAVENHCLSNTPNYTTLSDGTPTRTVLQTMAWIHDLGKLTTWWQEDHKNPTVPSISRPVGRVADHSHLGGIATWWVLDQLGYNPYIRLVAGIAVARHHNTLPDLSGYFVTRFVDADRWETARHQIENIDQYADETVRKIFESLADRVTPTRKPADEISWDAFRAAISEGYRSEIKQSVTQLTGQKLKRSYQSKSVYNDLLELWGGLKAADSPASAGVQPAVDRTLPDSSHVGEYINMELSPPDDPETLPERLNYKREQTRKQTLDTLADRVATSNNSNPDAASGQIYTLTLPTGAGKTLTGTQAALHLHDMMGNTGPILYILPYTSIIDQTESVYADLFGFNASSDGPTPTVGVDHYLADSTDEDDTELDTEKTAGNMAVTPLWHNDITLSTTVQLWETLCGPSKSQVLKLPQLYESTIIIDEPQSLPTEWFGRVEELLETLRDVFHANVILMSATQPPISYPPKSLNREAQELSPDDIEMPDNTAVTIDRSVVTDDTLSDQSVAETLADDVVSESNSVLSIHNTINNTNRVSNTLKHELSNCGVEHKSLHTIYDDLIDPDAQKIESLSDIDVYDPLPSVTEIVDAVSKAGVDTLTVTLTTRHRPCDRSRILDALTALLSCQTQCEATDIPQIIALTTQLVEAGVDISFESLYRDLAPYESLIQAAGRCNREYEYGVASGDMTIWHLADNDGGPGTPAEYVYQTGGANRLYLTAKTLSTIAGGGEQITEQRLIEEYEGYKQALEPKLSFPTDGLTNVNGRELTRASVIPDDGQSVSICIARTPTESRLIEAYYEAAEYNQRSQTAIRDTLSHIECSVRVDDDTNITDIAHKIDDTLYLVDNDQADTAYSKVGLTTQIDDTVSHRFH